MDTLNAALSYQRAGWAPVILYGASPDGEFCHCRLGANCPKGSRGKHPIVMKWASEPFPTEEDVKSLWGKHPGSNVGIRTGDISGVFVLDVDTGGFEALRDMVNAGGGMPETTVVRTGSGMWHYYFQIPEGMTITNSSKGLPDGVDIRGNGGQVVAPPSRSGKGEYMVAHTAEIPLPPKWLMDKLQEVERVETPVMEGPVEKRPPTADESSYQANLLRSQLSRLSQLRGKLWQPGSAWDQNCFEVACHLIELANAEWSTLTREQAYSAYMESAPRDSQWDQREEKWAQGLRTAGDKAKSAPLSLDDMAGIPAGSENIYRQVPESQAPDQSEIPPSDSMLITRFCEESLRHNAYYTDEMGWFLWDGKVWKQSPSVAMEQRYREWIGECIVVAAVAGNIDEMKFLSKYLSNSKIEGIPKRSRGAMLVGLDVFDQCPDLLVARNGVVNMITGSLEPHNPAYMMTKMTDVEYRPEARHDDWDMALRALPDDVADWMQVRFGQGSTGHPTRDDVLPICYGGGSNGKSSLFAGIQSCLGEYAGALTERALFGRSMDHTTDLADLRGMRIAVLEETTREGHLNVKRLKDVLGTSRMRARRMRENNVEWTPTHSLFLTTNYPPRITETDHGTWRRLALVTFPYRYLKVGAPQTKPTDRQGDPDLRARLTHSNEGQHEAVLAWLVAGAMRWYAADKVMPQAPASVVRDTTQWHGESDPIQGFIADNLEFEPGAMVPTMDLFQAFTAHLHANGMHPWAENTLVGRLREHEVWQANRVEKKRTSNKSGMSRWGRVHQDYDTSQQVMVWLGVRFAGNAEHTSNVLPFGSRA